MINVITKTYFSHAKDEEIRLAASSGGFCKAFLCYLVDNNIVDYVILTRLKDNSTEPETIITNDKNKILNRTNSIYEFNNQTHILKDIDHSKTYAFIGLPCFVYYIKKQQQINKLMNIKLTISLLCNQAPSKKYKEQLIKDAECNVNEIVNIDYRHGPSPGCVKIVDFKNQEKILGSHGYNWSKYNTKYCFSPACCRNCSLYESSFADIVVGDPWHTKYEKSKSGWTKVTAYTQTAIDLIEKAIDNSYIVAKNPDANEAIENRVVGKVNIKDKKKKRVLVATFHYAHNFGAMLQAYALQELLKSFGREVYFLNFFNANIHKSFNAERHKKFINFHNEFIQKTEFFESYQKLIDGPPKNFDTLLSGSDQIFNTEGGFINKSFFHSYMNHDHKIAYAASFGITYVHENLKNEFKELVQNFRKVSVREESGLEILNNMNVEADLCLDPTLLLPKKFWLGLSNKTNLDLPRNYTLVYSPSDKPLPITNDKQILFLDKNQPYGPLEFLKLIASADHVVTDSYHGRIFSFIFDKPVTAFAQDTRKSRFATLDKLLLDNHNFSKIQEFSIRFLIQNT